MTCHNITGKGSASGLRKGLYFYWPWSQLFTFEGKKVKPASKVFFFKKSKKIKLHKIKYCMNTLRAPKIPWHHPAVLNSACPGEDGERCISILLPAPRAGHCATASTGTDPRSSSPWSWESPETFPVGKSSNCTLKEHSAVTRARRDT